MTTMPAPMMPAQKAVAFSPTTLQAVTTIMPALQAMSAQAALALVLRLTAMITMFAPLITVILQQDALILLSIVMTAMRAPMILAMKL
jgi:hypothetical protein